MSMKKTDLEKHLAKKLDGRMKSTSIPTRFAQGSADAGVKRDKPVRDTVPKLVSVACRLPADLVNQMRERAASHEGGVNALIAQALETFLQAKA